MLERYGNYIMFDFMNSIITSVFFKPSLRRSLIPVISFMLIISNSLTLGLAVPKESDIGRLGSRATPVPGQHITINTTWTEVNSPYFIKGDLFVDSGINLTIEPGVVVQFDGVYSLIIDGILNVSGTLEKTVQFTSKAQLGSGDWGSIIINSTGKMILKNASISYGTTNIILDGPSENLIENVNITQSERWGVQLINSNNNTIIHSQYYLNGWSGLYFDSSTGNQVINCSFHDNDYDGFTEDYSINTVLRNCTFERNLLAGIHTFYSDNIQVINCSSERNTQNGVIFSGSTNGRVTQMEANENKNLGLYMHFSKNFLIEQSNFRNNRMGIQFVNSTDIIIESSNILNNKNSGIYLEDSKNNQILKCNIEHNTNSGIFLRKGTMKKIGSPHNKISNCRINNNTNGLYLQDSSNSQINNLDVINNTNGIFLFESSNSTIKNSKINSNLNGIRIFRSADVEIDNTHIEKNNIGVFFGTDSNRCIAHHNYILNNTINGGDSNPGNFWDDSVSEGNYWSDYNGTDYDENGIGDQPHPVTNFSQDNYPLVR
jgi:parallel beta-helix repeat protein